MFKVDVKIVPIPYEKWKMLNGIWKMGWENIENVSLRVNLFHKNQYK